jgi:DNA processing protein
MHKIITIGFDDPRYPERLKQIPDPPRLLYCRGNIGILHSSSFAVVGSRRITPYGKEITAKIVRDLAGHFIITSGLAMGVDAAAHTATLDAQGKTIAVLGSGIDDITPSSNKSLGERILNEDGLIISEYPPGSIAYPSNFPARNRIVSGLSLGVLVVEADEKSGALITARCALEQNRDVFAIPGSIFSPRSAGPNRLLQQGAKVVLSANDILQEYDAQLVLFPIEKKNLSTQNPLQLTILAILESNGPSLLDEIIRMADSDTPTVIAALSVLEIYGKVKQTGGGTYHVCN